MRIQTKLTTRRILPGILSLNNPFLSPFLIKNESCLRPSEEPGEGGPELVAEDGEDGRDLKIRRKTLLESRK